MNVARMRDAVGRVQDAERLRQLGLMSASMGNGQVLQVGVVLAPGEVDELVVGADAQHLRVAVGEVARSSCRTRRSRSGRRR